MGRRWIRGRGLWVVAVGVAAVVAGCGGSGDSAASSSGSATTLSTGGAKITKFDVPASVDCAGKTSTTVAVSYAVEDGKTQELVVDGLPIEGTDAPSDTLQVPVHCDPLPHTFVLVARDSGKAPTIQRQNLTTELGTG